MRYAILAHDDPSWIVDQYIVDPELDISFFQIEVLGELKNAWKFFKEEAPEFIDDELQISDIEEIGRKAPVIITLDYTVDNVLEIIDSIPTIKGICMTISEGTNIDTVHYFNYAAVLEIAKKLELSNR